MVHNFGMINPIFSLEETDFNIKWRYLNWSDALFFLLFFRSRSASWSFAILERVVSFSVFTRLSHSTKKKNKLTGRLIFNLPYCGVICLGGLVSDLDILEDLEDEPPFDTRWVFEIFVNEEVEVDFVDVDFEELPLKRPWPPTMIPFPPRSIWKNSWSHCTYKTYGDFLSVVRLNSTLLSRIVSFRIP